MSVQIPNPPNLPIQAMLLANLLLAACGGGQPPTPVTVQPPVQVPGQAPAPVPIESSGRLSIRVTDPLGAVLYGAQVWLGGAPPPRDAALGSVELNGLPRNVQVFVNQPLGHSESRTLEVKQNGDNQYTAVVQPAKHVAVALFPPRISPQGVSSDRTQLEVEFTLVSGTNGRFQHSSYSSPVSGDFPTPILRLEDCAVWLASLAALPSCNGWPGRDTSVLEYEYAAARVPEAPFDSRERYAAMLLLELGDRRNDYDPFLLKWFASRAFVRAVRPGPEIEFQSQTAVLGFGSALNDPDWPPLLLPQAQWARGLAAPFAASVEVQDQAILELASYFDPLDPMYRGSNPARSSGTVSAPVLDALDAAYRLAVAHAPATHRRSVVAVVAGGDQTERSESQLRVAQQALRQRQDETTARTILIAARLPEDSPERLRLAELADALGAPLIFAGFPENYIDVYRYDGLYSATELASELLQGNPLPTIRAKFRLNAPPGATFQSGSLLQGVLYVESAVCPMGCSELPINYAVRIP